MSSQDSFSYYGIPSIRRLSGRDLPFFFQFTVFLLYVFDLGNAFEFFLALLNYPSPLVCYHRCFDTSGDLVLTLLRLLCFPLTYHLYVSKFIYSLLYKLGTIWDNRYQRSLNKLLNISFTASTDNTTLSCILFHLLTFLFLTISLKASAINDIRIAEFYSQNLLAEFSKYRKKDCDTKEAFTEECNFQLVSSMTTTLKKQAPEAFCKKTCS